MYIINEMITSCAGKIPKNETMIVTPIENSINNVEMPLYDFQIPKVL